MQSDIGLAIDAVRLMVDTRIANIAVTDNENAVIGILNRDGLLQAINNMGGES